MTRATRVPPPAWRRRRYGLRLDRRKLWCAAPATAPGTRRKARSPRVICWSRSTNTCSPVELPRSDVATRESGFATRRRSADRRSLGRLGRDAGLRARLELDDRGLYGTRTGAPILRRRSQIGSPWRRQAAERVGRAARNRGCSSDAPSQRRITSAADSTSQAKSRLARTRNW